MPLVLERNSGFSSPLSSCLILFFFFFKSGFLAAPLSHVICLRLPGETGFWPVFDSRKVCFLVPGCSRTFLPVAPLVVCSPLSMLKWHILFPILLYDFNKSLTSTLFTSSHIFRRWKGGDPALGTQARKEQCHQAPVASRSGQSRVTSLFYPCLGHFSSVQSLSRVQLFATPWTSLSVTVSWSLLKLMSIQPSHPILLPLLLLPSIFPGIRVFSSGSALRIRWPNYWSFTFSIGPSNEYSGLISFRID